MKYDKAKGGRRKVEGGIGLFAVAMLLFATAGCTDRISPAAPTASIDVAANDDGSANDTANSDSAKSPAPLPVKPTGALPEQLASATDAEPVAKEKAQEQPAKPAAPGRIRDITFDDIKFDMDKEEQFFRSLLTPKVEKLFGQRIRVRGYILPSENDELSQFVLMRDNQECCFGPGAALYDAIIVDMPPAKTTKFTNFVVTVEGTFSLDEITYPDDETKHLAIYHMVADKVR